MSVSSPETKRPAIQNSLTGQVQHDRRQPNGGPGGLGGYSDPKYDYNSVDDSNTPSQTDGGSFGTPYEDMVENGRIRDTDGILSDGENPQN